MTERSADLIVVGAGPAGGNAALAAARAGLDVVLLDEGDAAGGQVWRAPVTGIAVTDDAALGPDHLAGVRLRAALAGSRVRRLARHRVWLVQAGFAVQAAEPEGGVHLSAPSLLLAPGTTERIVPFPGWTLPGVVGLAGATALIKGQRMLPGHNVVVAGAGPLLAAVAVAVIKGGGRVEAVVDLNGPADWLRALPGMMARPDLLARGLGWLALLRRHGVPYLARHGIRRAEGDRALASVTAAPVDAEGAFLPSGLERSFRADALAVGHGLVPASEMARLLGATHRHVPMLGGWVPDLDAAGRTSVAGLYIAGDGAGLRGAAFAVLSGEIAGLAVAHDHGRICAPSGELLRRAAKAGRFGAAMVGLLRPRDGMVAAIPADVPVCRCEDVTRGEIEAAFDEGARQIGQLKAWTRCGMGPCQGRFCGPTIEALAGLRGLAPAAFGPMVARAPLRPTLIGTITGDPDTAGLVLPPSLPSS